MTAPVKTPRMDAMNVAAASLRWRGLGQGSLRINDLALAERCVR
jgi:hypothetical protein